MPGTKSWFKVKLRKETSTFSALRMSAFSQSSPSRSTPKSRFHSHAVGKPIREDTRLPLLLQTVIGTTTSSANAFDCVPGLHTFVVCAGSAVVLARVDQELNIVQTFYRAGSDAVPVNASYSFYNASAPNILTDGPRNSASIFKETHLGYASPSMYGDSSTSSPGKTKASTRTRTASCVSLSPDGQFLAIGEVRPPLDRQLQADLFRQATARAFAFSGARRTHLEMSH